MGKGNQLSFFSFFFGEKNPPISSVSPCLSRPRLYFFFSLSFFLLFLAWKRCSASTRAACSSGNGGRAALVLGSQSRGFGRLANAARGIEAADLSHRLGIFRQEKDRCVSEGDASRRLAGVRHSLELLKCAHIHRGALTILLWISSATLKLRVWRCCPRSPLRVWRCCHTHRAAFSSRGDVRYCGRALSRRDQDFAAGVALATTELCGAPATSGANAASRREMVLLLSYWTAGALPCAARKTLRRG